MISGTLGAIGLWKLIQRKRREAEKKRQKKEEEERLKQMGLPPDYGMFTGYSPNSPAFNVPQQPTAPEKHPFLDMDYYDPDLENEIIGKKSSTKPAATATSGKRKKHRRMTGSGIGPIPKGAQVWKGLPMAYADIHPEIIGASPGTRTPQRFRGGRTKPTPEQMEKLKKFIARMPK